MQNYKKNQGLSLIEIVVTVAVIAILAGITIGIVSHMDNQNNARALKSTFALLDDALDLFNDYDYSYKNPAYAKFDFPIDITEPASLPSDFDTFKLNSFITILSNEFGLAAVDVLPVVGTQVIIHKADYVSGELLYFFLSRVPECREVLDKINETLITDKDENGYQMKLRIGVQDYPLLRIVDPWGTTLQYDYSNEVALNSGQNAIIMHTYPVITSAGRDKIFGTTDDIQNK